MPDDARLLVVTDLDATLLDEQYRFDAARPALDALQAGGHPLILASSKTLAEMRDLARRLDLTTPIIAENGGVIAWPDGDGHRIETPGLDRGLLLRHAHAWREAHDAQFVGFSDWTDREVASRTGLALEDAARARDRHATEPLLWHDTEPRREAFADAMARHGIRLLRGGRFWHLMGDSDKADGLQAVRSHYQQAFPTTRWVTVALGDSPNDTRMLEAADIAVVVPNPRHDTPLAVDAPRVLRAPQPGPVGWNAAVTQLLNELDEVLDG